MFVLQVIILVLTLYCIDTVLKQKTKMLALQAENETLRKVIVQAKTEKMRLKQENEDLKRECIRLDKALHKKKKQARQIKQKLRDYRGKVRTND